MTLDDFRSALQARGGHADLWLVAVVTLDETSDPVPRLERAFWTRGGAYAFAHRRHGDNPRHHCYVFRFSADATWVSSRAPRKADLETVVTAATDGRQMVVTPHEVAAVLEG